MDAFDPLSANAMFARIDEHLKAQDKAADARHEMVATKLVAIEVQAVKTNGRVTELENERWRQRGIVVAIGLILGALSWILPFLWPLLHR